MRGVVAGVAFLALLAGCTSDDPGPQAFTPAVTSSAAEIVRDDSWSRPPLPQNDMAMVEIQLSGVWERQDAAYVFAMEICRDRGVTALARDLDVASELDAVADAYADRHSGESHRVVTRDGCRRGLLGKSW